MGGVPAPRGHLGHPPRVDGVRGAHDPALLRLPEDVLKNYDGLLKIDGEVGNKKVYDPRSYLKQAEESMASRMSEACNDLESTGKTIFGKV